MLCIKLIKLNICVSKKRKEGEPIPPPPPPEFNTILIEDLLNHKIDNELFFTSKDSLYLFCQNFNIKELKFGKEIIDKINATTFEKESAKKEKGKPYHFYQMTIPFFSSDKQKAYIELNYHCGRLCGSGHSIYLKKINGKWKIVGKRRTWIS